MEKEVLIKPPPDSITQDPQIGNSCFSRVSWMINEHHAMQEEWGQSKIDMPELILSVEDNEKYAWSDE